jgi:hypothetical protein
MAYRKNFKVSWSEDNQEYVGLCQEFPQLLCYDESPVGALRGIRSLVDEELNLQDGKDRIRS